MPSFRACCRSAPSVRFICFAILATGVLAFECLRKSASKGLVQRTRFATLFAMHRLQRGVVTNETRTSIPQRRTTSAVVRRALLSLMIDAVHLAQRVRHLDHKYVGCAEA